MTMKNLPQSPEGAREARLAWQKSRSIAAENGYLHIMGTQPGPGSLDWALGNEKTLDMLLDYETGAKDITDTGNWANLVSLIRMSPSWKMGLTVKGFSLPEVTEIYGIMSA